MSSIFIIWKWWANLILNTHTNSVSVKSTQVKDSSYSFLAISFVTFGLLELLAEKSRNIFLVKD